MMAILCRNIRYSFVQRVVGWGATSLRFVAGSDERFIELVRRCVLAKLPRASEALDRYRRGGGGDVAVSLSDLLEEDRALAGHVSRELQAAMGSGRASGELAVPQWRISRLDWRFALGSFRLDWSRDGDAVDARISGRYDWSPGESRMTRAVHEAANSLKKAGARAFAFVSPATRFSLVRIASMARCHAAPRDRLYM